MAYTMHKSKICMCYLWNIRFQIHKTGICQEYKCHISEIYQGVLYVEDISDLDLIRNFDPLFYTTYTKYMSCIYWYTIDVCRV